MVTWKKIPKQALQTLLSLCDGWNVLSDNKLKKAGFPAELIDRLAKQHVKNKNGKRTIKSIEGEDLEDTFGVFTLDLLFDIAKDYELKEDVIKAETILDQTEQANVLRKAITKKLEF